MKNYVNQPLGFAILVLLLLTGLSLVPEGWRVGDFELRRMDIFADVRAEQPTAGVAADSAEIFSDPTDTLWGEADSLPRSALADSLRTDSFAPFPAKDSTLFGRILEDYSPEQQGLSRFFAAVDSIRNGRMVRVAWYGDSFVEGDILIGDLRDTLQTLWGGAGVGFVPITSEVAQFKRTLKHNFKGWTTFSIVKKNNVQPLLGINGYAYRPAADAKVHYEGAHYFKNTQRWTQFRLFYSAENPATQFVWQNQGEAPHQQSLPQIGALSQWKWESNFPGSSAFAVRFPDTASGVMLYGASLESGPGFYIDNFSVRGNSGGPLKLLRPDFIQKFNAYQRYDLVVLQVGLNAVTNTLDNIRWYEAELERTFKHLRACFPSQPILIVSVGDRGGKIGTELGTMRGVPAIVAMQRDLARKHGFLFYDLYRGMGGPNTMVRFAYQRPRLANTDYTHLTHEGGRVVGLMFANLFLEEQANWRARRANL